MAPSSIVFGNLLATILEAALFGLYTVLFVTVLYLFQSRERRPPQVVLIGLVVQFLALLGHWINTFYQALHAIGRLDPDAATAYYNSPSLSFRLDMVLFGVVTFATNVVMIHRVYVVFSRRIASVALPLAHLLGQFVAGSGIVYSLLKSKPGEEFSDLAVFWSPWVIAYLSISIVISVHTSCMIIRKLLRLRKAFPADVLLSGSGRTSFVAVCANITECAALQTAALISLLVTYRLASVAQIVFMEITPVILGISTVLIYARVGLGWSHTHSEDEPGAALSIQTGTAVRFASTFSSGSHSEESLDRTPTVEITGSK